MMREEHGVVLAGGQQSLSGKIFRIGHMGYTTAEEIEGVLTALYEVLPRLSPGQGVFTRTGISRRG
jgi:aspartate aminotransferase-like enzyme